MIQTDTKTQIFDRLRNFHETLRKCKHKAARDETYLFPAAVKFLGHLITKNKIRPLLNKTEAIQLMKRPESKKDVMKLLGAINY